MSTLQKRLSLIFMHANCSYMIEYLGAQASRRFCHTKNTLFIDSTRFLTSKLQNKKKSFSQVTNNKQHKKNT